MPCKIGISTDPFHTLDRKEDEFIGFERPDEAPQGGLSQGGALTMAQQRAEEKGCKLEPEEDPADTPKGPWSVYEFSFDLRIWQAEDENDRRIDKCSEWTSLDEYQEKLEEKAGVYIFADEEFGVHYVGKAGEGRMLKEEIRRQLREIANAQYREKDRNATQVKALYASSGDQALALEGDLIDKYDPPNNHKG